MAAAVTGCGAKKPAIDLRVAYETTALGTQRAHLTCDPDGGVARAGRVCRRLKSNSAAYLGPDKTCSPLTTVAVEVDGRYRGRHISEGYDCDLGYVHRWVALLRFKPTTAG